MDDPSPRKRLWGGSKASELRLSSTGWHGPGFLLRIIRDAGGTRPYGRGGGRGHESQNGLEVEIAARTGVLAPPRGMLRLLWSFRITLQRHVRQKNHGWPGAAELQPKQASVGPGDLRIQISAICGKALSGSVAAGHSGSVGSLNSTDNLILP